MTAFTNVWTDHDKEELAQSLLQVVKCIQAGDKVQGMISLRFSKGLVNNMHAIDAPAKAYLLNLFAELHMLLDSTFHESDLFYDQFLRAMVHLYGDNHAIIGDCYNVISNSRAAQGRFAQAISVTSQINSTSHTPVVCSTLSSEPCDKRWSYAWAHSASALQSWSALSTTWWQRQIQARIANM